MKIANKSIFSASAAFAIALLGGPSAHALSLSADSILIPTEYLENEVTTSQDDPDTLAATFPVTTNIETIRADQLAGEFVYSIDFTHVEGGGWFTGFSLSQVGENSTATSNFDAEILRDGTAIWSSYGASGISNVVKDTARTEEFDTHGTINWIGQTVTPAHQGFRIESGDSFELRLKLRDSDVSTAWNVSGLSIRSGVSSASSSTFSDETGGISQVPEPSSALLGLLGGTFLGLRRRR